MATTDAAVAVARVLDVPLDPERLITAVQGDAHGALVVFHGVVRDHDAGRAVTALEYEAHPTAERELRRIADDTARSVPGVRIAVAHRTGPLVVGDIALVAVVAAAHRAEAFEACAGLVDELKHRVPIWKRQRFADGESEWVGL